MTKKKKTTIALIAILSISVFSFTATAQVRDLGLDSILDQLPPNTASVWSDSATGNLLGIDLYGKWNTLFGLGLPTVVSGKATARNVGGGNEQVTINLHVRNAFCLGLNADRQPVLGYRPPDVTSGVGPAAIGDATAKFVMRPTPAGQFIFSLDPDKVESYFATITCDGLLRAASGYPEGTPGLGQTTQLAFIGTGCPIIIGGFCVPDERIQFIPTGN